MKVKDITLYWDHYSETPIPITDPDTSKSISDFLVHHNSQQTFYAAFDSNKTLYVFAQLPNYRDRMGEWDVIIKDAKYPREGTLKRLGIAQIDWCWQGEAGITLHTVTKAQIEEFAKRVNI